MRRFNTTAFFSLRLYDGRNYEPNPSGIVCFVIMCVLLLASVVMVIVHAGHALDRYESIADEETQLRVFQIKTEEVKALTGVGASPAWALMQVGQVKK